MPKFTPEQDAELIANVLEKIKVRLEVIKTRPIPPMSYVLGWPDNRFVGPLDDTGEPQIVGFEHAIFLDGHGAAGLDWLRNRRADDSREQPEILHAIIAQQQAIDELEQAIEFMRAGDS